MTKLPKRLLAATGNKNKLRELQTVGAEYGVEIVSPQALQMERGLGLIPDPIEDADSYRGNALIKAKALYDWAGVPTIADDSGLEVAVLEGRPGVLSARYGGPGLSDKDRYEKLLSEIKTILKNESAGNRSAAFVCSLVCILSENSTLYADSRMEGQIVDVPRGEKGFGYDPIVHIYSLQATLAEVDFETVTCKQGFRAQAMRQLLEQFEREN